METPVPDRKVEPEGKVQEAEKPEIEPYRTSPSREKPVQLTLLDLWGMKEEVRKEETASKKLSLIHISLPYNCVINSLVRLVKGQFFFCVLYQIR